MYFIYIIECVDGSLYTGIAKDVGRRFKEHKAGKGGHYTRAKGVIKILYSERRASRGAALKREAEIKGWKRHEKLEFIKSKKLKR